MREFHLQRRLGQLQAGLQQGTEAPSNELLITLAAASTDGPELRQSCLLPGKTRVSTKLLLSRAYNIMGDLVNFAGSLRRTAAPAKTAG